MAEQGSHYGNLAHFGNHGEELVHSMGEKGVEQVEPLLRGLVDGVLGVVLGAGR